MVDSLGGLWRTTMASILPSLLRFADFEVDLRAGQLRRQGRKIRLQEQPFRVLAALLKASGNVVTREELRNQLWAADTFVDFDHRLASAINKLRNALNDSAEKPTFVETVGRRGYRFMVPVEPVTPSAGDNDGLVVPKGAPSHQAERESRAPRVGWFAAALVLVSALAFVAIRHRRQPDSGESAVPRISSIAVLPLENLSNDQEQEYFVEGMTDEIITDLAKLPGIRVISRTSAIQYKGTHKTLPEIARELNVDGVVEGSVLRDGNRVRIRTQLVYAPTDRHVWAQAYERDLKDVLTLQADLAQDIAREIQLKLTSQERVNLVATHPVDPEAHELYLKGRFFWNKRDQQGFARAIEYFQQAIERDPTYALAYSGLADAYVLLGWNSYLPPREAFPKAKMAAMRALRLDPNLGEAHAGLAAVLWLHDWQWEQAEAEFTHSLTLNPSYPTANHWYAEYLMTMGYHQEAIARMKNSQELDPLSLIISVAIAWAFYMARQYDDAIGQLQRTVQLEPAYPVTYWILGQLLRKMGRYEPAITEGEKGVKLSGGSPLMRAALAQSFAMAGRREQAIQIRDDLTKLKKQKYVSPYFLAGIHAGLGEDELAMEYLEKGHQERSHWLLYLHIDPGLDSLRRNPRFQDLLQRIGLPLRDAVPI